MHRTSEYGIAAHWRYKEGGKADQFENKLTWLRSLLEWQKDMRDSRMFMENLKLDLFDSQVFVFSPSGDVFSMPAGGTPLDFAYQVHTDVGNHCVGAQGQRPDRSARLQRCKTATSARFSSTRSSGRPSLDWLSIVKTSSAKHKIKQWFRKEQREENVLAGQEAVETELARAHLRPDLARGELIERIAHRMNYARRRPICSRRSASATRRRSRSSIASATRLKADNVVDLVETIRKTAHGAAHRAEVERHPHRRRRRRARAALEVLFARCPAIRSSAT